MTFFPGLNTKASGGSLHSLEGKSELGLVMDGAGLGDGAQVHYVDFLSPNEGLFRNSQPGGSHSL